MNVASLENCKELYELSGWHDTNMYSYADIRLKDVTHYEYSKHGGWWYSGMDALPAYDSGYLLRKLPEYYFSPDNADSRYQLTLVNGVKKMQGTCWGAMYDNQTRVLFTNYTDTPEDALALLAIQLFKQGILSKASDVTLHKGEGYEHTK